MAGARYRSCLASGLFLAASASGAILPEKPDWSIDFSGEAIGYPACFGNSQHARGVLITLRSGQIVLVDPDGRRRIAMQLDRPIETSAVAAELRGKDTLAVVAVDVVGSVYC